MADRLDQLAADLEALKIEFEKYFIGVEKRMPARQREQLSREIRRYTPGNDAVEKFRHQGLVQRLSTYNRYWNRILRAIEEGTYERDRFKADYRAKQRQTETVAEPKDDAAARRKAAEVGDEAAAFLAQLTGGPSVGMRGRAAERSDTGGQRPVVGMRGRSVADRPSVDTRDIVRSTLTPGKGIERPARPSGGQPAVGLRGRPMDGRPSGGHPAVGLRGRPMDGRPSGGLPPVGLRGQPRDSGAHPATTPSSPSTPAARPPAPPVSKPSGLPKLPSAPERPSAGGLSGLKGLGARSGGLVGGLSGRKPASPPAPPPPPPPPPRAKAPSPRGVPQPRTSSGPPAAAPRGRPVPRSRVSSPAPPMRGAPKAPPAPPMRGAPKAPPSPPMRGRPIDDD